MTKKRVLKNSAPNVSTIREISGLTVLEVTLAIVILTIITTVIMHFLLAGDRLYGRSILIESATQLARNEAELIKAQALVSEPIEDQEYEKQIGSRSYIVVRKVTETDSLVNGYPLREIELQVKEEICPEKPLVTFKFIQGYDMK